ncbi:MAG TPA: phosphate regulon sensor histidine kinase PhoR [Pseudomonadales bacterium]
MMPSRQDWLIIGALALAALLLGAITGAWTAMLLLAVLVWVVLQHRELSTFVAWARRPLTRPRNRLETWQRLSDHLYRRLRESRGRTARALERLRTLKVITDALPDAAVIVDRVGAIEDFNRAAGAFLRLKHSDRGANLAALVRHPEFVSLVRGQHTEDLVEFASPFDDDRRLEARRIPIDSRRALVLVRDVTQLNRLLTMRQDFVANVSHELRTPLTVVVGYLETMSSEALDAATLRELLGKLESPTRRMRALVDDLLLLSRLESSPQPDPESLTPVDVCAVIRGCIGEARVLSGGKHRFECECDRTQQLLGVENELYSAILNMLTNAVRYSPDGGDVTITWAARGAGARLAVRDQGIGIAPEHLQRITERFYRVDLARSRVRGGTGLGLAIVKHVLKRHGSALQVESELGRGSTFFCDFPAHAVRRTSPTPQEAP